MKYGYPSKERLCYADSMIETFDVPLSVWFEYDHQTRSTNIIVVELDANQYTITKLAHRYTERSGRTLFHIFCVATETVTLKLRFNTTTLQWRCVERRIHGMD